jgi:2-polyprenyl-6-methoxyphenol hydroxylase-like FAD-dependent oxidoreductase
VSRIEHKDTGIIVHCDDGSSFPGDIAVGADGVYSTVRREMQNYIKTTGPNGLAEKDENRQLKTLQNGPFLIRSGISAEYCAVFGISSHNPGIVPGHSNRTYAKDFSTIIIGSNDRRIYWFIFTKLDKRYHGDDIPKFRNEDADTHLRPYFDMPINDKLTVKDLWETRLSYSVPLEEAKYGNWTYDRFVCLGDSIHKVTAGFRAHFSKVSNNVTDDTKHGSRRQQCYGKRGSPC